MRAYWSIGVALACFPQIADAQEIEERRVDIRLTNRVLYDSNIIRRGASFESVDGLERSDIRITPGVSVDILLPVSRQSLFLAGEIGYDFYLRNKRLNRERLSLIGGANLRAGTSCSARVTGSYVRQQSDLADLFVVGEVENTEERRGIGVRLDCGGPIGLTPGLGYRHETANSSTERRQFSDYVTDSYEADIGYSRPTFGRLAVFGRYSDSAYPNRIVGGITDGVEVYSTGVSFQREIGSRLRGSVSGGYTWVKPKLPGTADYGGTSYSADITYMPSDRLQTTIGFSREAQLSNLLAISYSITENYRFSGIYAFGPSLRLSFGTSYTTREFEQSPQFPTLIQQTADKTYQAHVGLSRQWNDRFSTELNFIQERRDSDGQLFDYKSTQVGLTLSLAL